MDGGHGALSSSEKAKGKEKVEAMGASKTIGTVEGEDNSSAAGGFSPGDTGANASQRDEAMDVWAKKMLDKIDLVLQKPQNYTPSKNFSTVPANTVDRGNKLYEPKAVAIGPFHRKTEDNNFIITDEHKLWFLQKEIGNNYKLDLGKFLGKIKEREKEAVKFYSDRYGKDYPGMDSQSFLEMLMLDSCFILFALSFRFDLAKAASMIIDPTAVPIWHWAQRDMLRASEFLMTDLLLLNNQIPFFILEDVFKMTNDIKMQNGGNEGNGSIRKVALEFFDTLGLGRNNLKDTETGSVDHLLHLYHKYLKPPVRLGRSLFEDIVLHIDPQRSLPSATDLQRKSAVNFKVKNIVDPPKSVLDVTTAKFGDIKMPALCVYDHTNILLHNLIRFEQTVVYVDSYISAYVAFMHHIVLTKEDVELLENSGVLEHRLTSPKDVVALFRQLHNVIDHSQSPGYLAKVYEDARRCYNSKWRRLYADAKQRYCSNVWLSIGFVAGVALSVLTLIETIYAIIGFYQS